MKSYCKGLRVDHELVYEAYIEWRESESGHKNHWRLNKEYEDLSVLADEIVNEIRTRTLSFEPIRYHEETERNGKVRHIGQESVKQQICDYVALVAMKDFIHARVGFYQVASTKGKGPLFAAKQVQRWIKEDGRMCYVHGDIKKCYESIQHKTIFEIVCKYIKSRDIVYLIGTILSTYDKGLGIGSALSLKLSQVVLSFAYHHVEALGHTYRRGKRIRTIIHQIWYADDFYLFSKYPSYIKWMMRNLTAYLKRDYMLDVKRWKISWTDCEPVDIAGYVVREDRLTIRPKIYLRIRRAYVSFNRQPTLKKARTVCSYWGYLYHTDSRKAIARNSYYTTFCKARRMVSRAF